MFLLGPAYPGCPGSKAVKRSLRYLVIPILLAWYGKKLNLTQRKHAFTNQRNVLQHKKKLKTGLVTFHDIRPGNGAGLFSNEKISKGGDKEKK